MYAYFVINLSLVFHLRVNDYKEGSPVRAGNNRCLLHQPRLAGARYAVLPRVALLETERDNIYDGLDVILAEEDRIALAVVKPAMTTGTGSAEITWTTGPNVFSYDFTVTCYQQDVTVPTDNCGAVELSGLVPIAVETGTLPRLYSKVAVDITDLPTDSSAIDCFIDIDGGPVDKVRKCMPVPQKPFRLALNGVTVTCLDADVGDTGVVNGIEYTKRDRDALLGLVGNEITEDELATSCTSGVADMSELFGYIDEDDDDDYDYGFLDSYAVFSKAANASTFNPDISSWDLSSVTNTSAMLAGSEVFDGDVSAWDTAEVIDMSFAFAGASTFNESLVGYGWDTSAVTDMVGMFYNASAFNQDLNHFDMASVANTSYMFSYATTFNNGDEAGGSSNPLDWETTSLTETKFMFLGAEAFNQPVDSFEMSSVKVTAGMFAGAAAFNQELEDWTMSSVERMDGMFGGALVFNQSVNGWDTSSVTNMSYVFLAAEAFNEPLDNWVTSSVQDMRGMFLLDQVFNQNLSSWDTSNVESFAGTFAATVRWHFPASPVPPGALPDSETLALSLLADVQQRRRTRYCGESAHLGHLICDGHVRNVRFLQLHPGYRLIRHLERGEHELHVHWDP